MLKTTYDDLQEITRIADDIVSNSNPETLDDNLSRMQYYLSKIKNSVGKRDTKTSKPTPLNTKVGTRLKGHYLEWEVVEKDDIAYTVSPLMYNQENEYTTRKSLKLTYKFTDNEEFTIVQAAKDQYGF